MKDCKFMFLTYFFYTLYRNIPLIKNTHTHTHTHTSHMLSICITWPSSTSLSLCPPPKHTNMTTTSASPFEDAHNFPGGCNWCAAKDKPMHSCPLYAMITEEEKNVPVRGLQKNKRKLLAVAAGGFKGQRLDQWQRSHCWNPNWIHPLGGGVAFAFGLRVFMVLTATECCFNRKH